MPFKQSYSAPDLGKSLLPLGEGLHDSYQKLVFINSLMNIQDNAEMNNFLASYVSDYWARIFSDLKFPGSVRLAQPGTGCRNCKGAAGGKHVVPCKVHCWTHCNTVEKFTGTFKVKDIDSVTLSPVGGGTYKELYQLMKQSKANLKIIKKERYEAGFENGKSMLVNFPSLKTPLNQGIPLVETTLLAFSQNAIEHKESNGVTEMSFTPGNFFAEFSKDSKIFDEIMLVEMNTSAQWFAGYCAAIAKVVVEYKYENKQDSPFCVTIKKA